MTVYFFFGTVFPSLKVNPPIPITQGHYKVTSHVDFQSYSILDLTLLLQYSAALLQGDVQF